MQLWNARSLAHNIAMSENLEREVQDIVKGDLRAVAKSISKLESGSWSEESLQLLRALYPNTGNAFVVGITGSPGVGKSSLVDGLTGQLRSRGHRVAIVAVDPTSPFSGGAVLGDRIRMQRHSTDAGVFIRSMATRGTQGGLAPTVQEALVVLDAAGFDYILLETVGAGQDEVEVVYAAHMVLVVLAPDLGDDVQTIKAGLMEISDLFILNKADLAGADRSERDILAMLELAAATTDYPLCLIKTIANQGEGIENLVARIDNYQDWFKKQSDPKSQLAVHKHRLRELLKTRLEELIYSQWSDSKLESLALKLRERETDPYTVVTHMLAGLDKGDLND